MRRRYIYASKRRASTDSPGPFNTKNIVMKKNMGSVDRILRVIIAAVFAWLYFGGIVTGTLGIILVALGGVFLLTSLVGFCPLYAPFGINTCGVKKTS